MKRIVDKVTDFLKISLFWKTIGEIDKLKRIQDEEKRYEELNRFVIYVKNKIPVFDICDTPPKDEMKTWDDLYGTLEYFSDRWAMSRLNRIYSFYDRHRYEKLMGETKA